MKLIIYILSMLAVITIYSFLNYLSEGNISGIGLGDFIMIVIAFSCISNVLIKNIWGEKK